MVLNNNDARLDEAKLIPITEVAQRLGVAGLRRAGQEQVGPCPVCGGSDRFSINTRKEVFNCRVCARGGDGVALVEFVHGCSFKEALEFLVGKAEAAPNPERIARIRQQAEEKARKQKEIEIAQRARAIRDAREAFNSGVDGQGTLVEDYLAGRGIRLDPWPPAIRFVANHPYMKAWCGRVTEWFSGPCMVSAIQDASGRITAVHQTWIDPANPGKKRTIVAPDGSTVDAKGKPYPAKLVRGSKKGGAIRLSPMTYTGVMVMGEGIETTASALTVNARPGAVFWAGVDLGNMAGRQEKVPGKRYSGQPDMTDDEAWLPPEWITELIFIRDGDSDPKSTEAKLNSGLRRAMAARPGLRGLIVNPGDGLDLNDLLKKQNQEAEQSNE